MKSTQLIHEIVSEFGSEDNRDLYRALKALRQQTKKEIISTIRNAEKLIDLHYENQ